MKPAVLAARLSPMLGFLRCPRCASPFHLTEQSLVCGQGHCFDLSRRGYVNLAPAHDQNAEKYDAGLFDSRRTVLEGGFYQPVLDAVSACLPKEPFLLLDVGCGEGWYARRLAEQFPLSSFLGLDISRDAITAAASIPGRVNWLVADLKHLPIADGSADVVLDVLTPADYAAFRRVLQPDGRLIKVIPGTDYLREVRSAAAHFLRGGSDYDNTRVLEHLKANASVLSSTEIRVTRPLSPEESRAFLHMTPMTFSVPPEALADITLPEITIHMHVLYCSMQC